MGELKGQLLGVLLVLMLFGAISVTFKSIVDNANSKISSEYNQLVSNLDKTSTPATPT